MTTGLVGLISRVRQFTLNLPVLGRLLTQPPSLQKLLKPVKYRDAVGRRRRLFKLFVRSLAAQINPFLSVRTATCWLPGDRDGRQPAFLGLARRQFIWRNKATDVQDSSLGRSNGKLSYGQPSSPSRGPVTSAQWRFKALSRSLDRKTVSNRAPTGAARMEGLVVYGPSTPTDASPRHATKRSGPIRQIDGPCACACAESERRRRSMTSNGAK